MRFYDKVSNLCKNKGISITALALELGFSKGSPTNWKTMTKPPRAVNVKKIADYFGVPIDYLLEDDSHYQSVQASKAPVAITNGNHNTITLTNGETHTRELSEIETEIMRICEKFDTRQKSLLLAEAYRLLENKE